jgi:hypothetical protein
VNRAAAITLSFLKDTLEAIKKLMDLKDWNPFSAAENLGNYT